MGGGTAARWRVAQDAGNYRLLGDGSNDAQGATPAKRKVARLPPPTQWRKTGGHALFVFGSIRYRLDKNALTYGGALVIAATFFGMWWPTSALCQALYAEGLVAMWPFVQRHFLTLHGLDNLVHADAMLFILGLTFFVAIIAQTRLLETASFAILRRSRGHVPTTVAMIAALVAFASGIVDGLSMIGLMIRTMVIILLLSKTDGGAVVYAVMVSTVVTTVCGMWLAYGEPPNLIMKANLAPHLDNAFFLRYCLLPSAKTRKRRGNHKDRLQGEG